ncbi:MAG: hypothetical protein ACWGQW_20590, partial [bacterium]
MPSNLHNSFRPGKGVVQFFRDSSGSEDMAVNASLAAPHNFDVSFGDEVEIWSMNIHLLDAGMT